MTLAYGRHTLYDVGGEMYLHERMELIASALYRLRCHERASDFMAQNPGCVIEYQKWEDVADQHPYLEAANDILEAADAEMGEP